MLEVGQIIPIQFKGREFNAIIIDPDGLGPGKPSIGVGYRGMSRHLEMPASTLQRRVLRSEGVEWLELPSGKRFRVLRIDGNDGNEYNAIEATDWVAIATDWLKTPGRLSKKAREGLIDFLGWYAAEGLYADAYTFLKATYTREDNETIQRWLVSREAGKPARVDWAYTIAEQGGGSPYKYGKWTNYVYKGLFGMDAGEMKAAWEEPVQGSRAIARNYIPEALGLEMVSHCEKLVSVLGFENMEQAHDEAIRLTQMKYREALKKQQVE